MSRRWSSSTRLHSHGHEPADDFAESRGGRQPERQPPRRGTLDRMSYAVEWMGGAVVFYAIVLLLVVPWFAAIAVVVATIAVLVGLVALAAAALASPSLIVRSVRRRLPNEEHDGSTRRARSGADRLRAWAEHA